MGKRSLKRSLQPVGSSNRAAGSGHKGAAADAAGAASDARRKLVTFDAETWNAIDLLGRDALMTFQDLADEAFRDLLRKHGRPVELRDQLKRSARAHGETTDRRRT